MRIKIYRWLDYNKWLFITYLIGLLIVGYFISCQPKGNDVQIHYKSDTTDTTDINANKGHN